MPCHALNRPQVFCDMSVTRNKKTYYRGRYMSTDKFKNINAIQGSKALEMIMRDVLDGMEELANIASFDAAQAEFEILAIEKPNAVKPAKSANDATHPDNNKTADIVSFIEKREEIALKLSA